MSEQAAAATAIGLPFRKRCRPQAFGRTVHTARQPHTCDQCGREIYPGDEYERWAKQNGSGSLHTLKYHHNPDCGDPYDWDPWSQELQEEDEKQSTSSESYAAA